MKKPVLIGIASLAVLVLVYWLLAWRDEVNLQKAQAAEAVAAAALAEKAKAEESARLEREAHELERKQWQEQQAALMRSVVARNQTVDRVIGELRAPSRPVEQIIKDSEQQLGMTPVVHPDNPKSFSLSQEQFQELIAIKVDRDRLFENLKSTEQQLDLERQSTATLKADLDRALKGIQDANNVIELQGKTIEAYKKAATKTRLRKVLEFGGRAGITIGLAYLGAKAGSR